MLIGFVMNLLVVVALVYSGAAASQDGSEVVAIEQNRAVSDFALQVDPVDQSVCAPDDAVYGVQVQSLNGFTDTVTLSLSGNPAGTSAGFSPNPADAPFTSTMTISDTGAASAGSYELEISGIAPTATHTTTVGLDIFDSAPVTVTLTSPSNGAIGVSTTPLFEWQAVSQAYSYTLDVDDDSGFGSIDYSATVTGTTEHLAESNLDPLTMYYWRVRADNTCGSGSYSTTFNFTTREVPPVLLVDDDDNSPDVQSTYTATLDTILGADGYDIWDTDNSDDEPNADTLSMYDAVIWFTGGESDAPAGPGNEGEADLATWLDSSGCLFLSSQDYHSAKGLTSFMANYLGAASVTDDTGQTAITGENTVFAGLGPYPMSYPFTDNSDEIYPDGAAEVAFSGSNTNGSDRSAAVNKQGTTYATVFLGYPWEAIAGAGDREEVLTTFFGWCENGADPNINSTPGSISENVLVNDVVTNTLTITNTGTGNLVWDVGEAESGNCAAPEAIDWVTLSDTSGYTGAGLSSDIAVVFDAGDLNVGEYSGALCISSNDASTPMITVTLDMSVTDFSLQVDPIEQSVCEPDDAVYSVQVQSVNGFTGSVTLSLTGNPSGTTVEFLPNPASAPFTSTMTIGDTSGVSGGSYDMEISGITPATTHTTTVSLDFFELPGTVVLTSPSNGAVDVSLKPLLDWQATTEANSYTVEVDDDLAFNSIDYSATITGTTEHMVVSYLDSLTEYYWRVRAVNSCGSGSNSTVFSFTTRDVPPVLLVDDDDDIPDVQATYTAALDALLGADGYEVWDTNNTDDEPDADTLSFYDSVIWFTGAEYQAPSGPGDDGEAALATWLDSGGCLFLSSTDYHWAKGRPELTPFMEDYLGVEDVVDDTGQDTALGQNAVFAGLGPYTLSYPFQDFSDEIFPDNTAEIAFTGTNDNGDNRNAAISKEGSTYVTAYLVFPWEAIPTAGDREEVLTTFFDWCESRPAPSIDATPASIDEEMMVNDAVMQTLTISNTGTGMLVWDIEEAASGNCASPAAIDWVSVSDTTGFTAGGTSSEVVVTFDASDKEADDYSGALCINSNDASTPLITVSLSMSVDWYVTYLSRLMR